MPRILALHLKRFQVTLSPRGAVECSKVRTPVGLSQALRMGPFSLDAAAPPLLPLQPTQSTEKENRGDNAVAAATRAAAAAAAPAPPAASPPLRHAVGGVRTGSFYSGSSELALPHLPRPSPPLLEKRFYRRGKEKGAAAADYWDNGMHKKPASKLFTEIIGAAGSPGGRRRKDGKDEEAEAVARALAESAAEAAAKVAAQQEQEENELATAIKRSLEEKEAEEAAAAAAAALTSGLESWMVNAKLRSGTNDLVGDAPTPVTERKVKAAADTATAAALAPTTLGPPPEIVEDDADVGDLGGSQASTKAEGGLASGNVLPFILKGAEVVPDAPTNFRVRTYRLTAVISHHGTRAESGHFTADAKDASTGAWHRFNDAHVSAITGAAAVGDAAQRDCYMLFYSAI